MINYVTAMIVTLWLCCVAMGIMNLKLVNQVESMEEVCFQK